MIEMLLVLLIIGSVLTVRHVPVTGRYSSSWVVDAATIALGVFGAAFGTWFAWMCEFGAGMRRAAIVASLLLSLLAAGIFCGRTTYTCWRCGAVLDDVYGLYSTVVEDSYLSQRIAKASGHACSHPHWQFRASNSLVALSSVESARAPILMQPFVGSRPIIGPIESLPKQEWRLAAIDALGDEKNHLKYAAMAVLLELPDAQPTSEGAWDAWWSVNAEAFHRQPSPTAALPVAQAVVNRLAKPLAVNLKSYLEADVPGIVVA
jgi:hypothetical protein